MQNNYDKTLAIKTFQEEIHREYYKAQGSRFHWPSFSAGVLIAMLVSIPW
jgi:hypothetical protein